MGYTRTPGWQHHRDEVMALRQDAVWTNGCTSRARAVSTAICFKSAARCVLGDRDTDSARSVVAHGERIRWRYLAGATVWDRRASYLFPTTFSPVTGWGPERLDRLGGEVALSAVAPNGTPNLLSIPKVYEGSHVQPDACDIQVLARHRPMTWSWAGWRHGGDLCGQQSDVPPHVDGGDSWSWSTVKIALGDEADDKLYHRHSAPGQHEVIPAASAAKDPLRVELAMGSCPRTASGS